MRFVIWTVLIMLSTLTAAQEAYSVTAGGKSIKFEEIDNLSIVGYDGSELKITRRGGSEAVTEQTEGLRKISAAGLQDNTGYGLSSTEEDGALLFRQVGKENGTIVVQVPNSALLSITQSTYRGGDLAVTDFNGELDVTMMYHTVELANVYGPIAINCVYGEIVAIFSEGAPTKDLRLHSTYNNVDVTIPADAKADLQLYTGYGDMYTDLDITITKNLEAGSKSREDESHTLNGKLNGGGTKISLQSSYEDVYLRKLK